MNSMTMTTEALLLEVGLLLYVAEMRRRVRDGGAEIDVTRWAEACMLKACEQLDAIEANVSAICN